MTSERIKEIQKETGYPNSRPVQQALFKVWNECTQPQEPKETGKKEKHASIDEQVSILKDTLEEMMTGFDSEGDKMDFILDICNGYKKRIEKPN